MIPDITKSIGEARASLDVIVAALKDKDALREALLEPESRANLVERRAWAEEKRDEIAKLRAEVTKMLRTAEEMESVLAGAIAATEGQFKRLTAGGAS